MRIGLSEPIGPAIARTSFETQHHVQRGRGLRPIVDLLDQRCLPWGSPAGPSGGFTPAQITAAYGLNAIAFHSTAGPTVKGDGTGKTIAIVEMYHNPNLASDLHTFDQQFGLPDPILTVDNQAGSRTDDSWAGEEALDVESRAHAIAPAPAFWSSRRTRGSTTYKHFRI